MEKNRKIAVFLLLIVCLLMGACAPRNPQLGLRGNPNSPWVNMQYLQINPNAMMHMSKAEYNELARRVNNHNKFVAQMLRNDRTAAQNAKIWTGDVNRNPYSFEKTFGKGFDRLVQKWINSIDF